MALVPRKNRRDDLTRFKSNIDDLFDSFFKGWDFPAATQGGVWPAMDIAEKENEIELKAELPGCKPDDIDISVNGNILTISGEKKEEKEDKDKGYYYAERSYGQFRRDVNLPSEVDPDKIEATYKDGILNVTLPKAEGAQTKKIKVKGG